MMPLRRTLRPAFSVPPIALASVRLACSDDVCGPCPRRVPDAGELERAIPGSDSPVVAGGCASADLHGFTGTWKITR
jgi:hypothetical protein